MNILFKGKLSSSYVHVDEEAFPWRDKSFFRSKLVSAISLLFFSVIFLYSSSSFCVLARSSSASWIFFLRSSSSPWTAAVASAASRSRSSLSFDDPELEDGGVWKPTLFRNWLELFWESTFDRTCTLDAGISPSGTGSALKASISDWNIMKIKELHVFDQQEDDNW